MAAEVCNLKPGDFVYTLGDAHIYHNHFDQIEIQIKREPFTVPQLRFARPIHEITDFQFDDIILENYQAHPHIKGVVAV